VGEPDVEERIILKLGLRLSADHCEHGKKPSDSIRGMEYLYYMSDYQLFNK
jgi:hypothetical protein